MGASRGWGLRARFTALLLATLLPLLGLAVYWVLFEVRDERAGVERAARGIALRVAAQTGQRVGAVQEMLKVLAQVPAVQGQDRGGAERLFREVLATSPHLENIALIATDGTVAATAVPLRPGDRVSFRGREWFQKVVGRGERYVGGFQVGQIVGKPVVVLAVPIREGRGQVRGAVGASLRLSAVSEEVAPVPPGWQGLWAVVDRQGLVLLHGDHTAAIGKPLGPLTKLLRAEAAVPGTEWRAIVGIPGAVVTARVRARLVRVGLPALLILVGAAGVGFWIAYGTWRPLGHLAAAARALGAGTLDRRVPVGGAPEINELATAFNEMADRRQRAEADLQAALVRREALNQLSVAIAGATNREEILRRVVSATRQLLGAPYAVLWVLGPAGTELTVAAEEADPSLGPLPSQAPFPLAGSFAESIIGEGRPVALPDVRQNPRWQNASWAGLEQLAAYVAVPLLREGVLVGFLAAMDRPGRDFTNEEVELLRALGTHAALAIEKVNLLETARKAAERAQALVEVGRLITATLELNLVLDLIVDKVLTVTGADFCGISHVTGEGELEYIRAKGFGESLPPNRTFPRGEGLMGRCRELGATVWSRDLVADPAIVFRPEMRARVQSRGGLAAPILTSEGLYGVLFIGHRQPHNHSPEEIAFAEALAAQAGTAIQNARLYEESQRRTREATALAEVSRALSASLDLDRLLDQIVEQVQRVMGIPFVGILTLDEAHQELTYVKWAGLRPERMARVPLKVGEGIAGQAIEQKVPAQSPNLLEDPRFATKSVIQEEGFQSLLIAPMLAGDRPLGALAIFRREAGPFGPAEVELLTRFADHASLAMQNATLYAAEAAARREAEEALGQVRRLQGLLPICSYCKKIRDDKNYWQQVEHYVTEHSEAQFSHSICPDCYVKFAKPEMERVRRSRGGPS